MIHTYCTNIIVFLVMEDSSKDIKMKSDTEIKDRGALRTASSVATTVFAIGKLCEAVMKRDVDNLKSIGGEHPELQILREKCKDSDPVISSAACQAIVTLVSAGILTIPNSLSTFLAMLPYCGTHGGVTSALGQLLILDMKMRCGSRYRNPFNLQSPQHPLITVLRQKKGSTWQAVLSQIAHLLQHEDKMVQENSQELILPVILYVMCNPEKSAITNGVACKQQLWSLLLSLPHNWLLESCIPWLQMLDTESAQPLLLQLVSQEMFKGAGFLSKPYLALHLASLVNTLILEGGDPWLALNALNKMTTNCTFTNSCVVIMVSQTITHCPGDHLTSIILLCSKIIKQETCILLAGRILSSALLPWLSHPSVLTADALQAAQSLLTEIDSLTGVAWSPAPFPSHSCPLAHSCLHIYSMSLALLSEPKSVMEWLRQLNTVPESARLQHLLLLGALLIHPPTSGDLLAPLLAALVTLAQEFPQLGSSILTWILYRLAREKEPLSQLELLRALPLLCTQKDNVSLVIHTLESLRTSITLRPLLLDLYLRLWKREPRCFPYLHKLLAEQDKDRSKLWNISRSVTIKEICKERPSQHGTELVALLSTILNECMNPEGSLASSLALQAIAILCRAKVVDTATTWRALAPRMSRDTRPAVVESLCDILGLLSHVRASNPEQGKLCAEAQSKLWGYVAADTNTAITTAAIKALAEFPIEQLSLKLLPAKFREDLKLPAEYCKTPIDAARKPEDVLPYIPGDCWVQLLMSVPSSIELVKSLLVSEVGSMRGALHRRPGRGEPSLPPLGPSSVCLALVAHLRRRAEDQLSSPALVPALQALTSPLPHQLPPCDWSFLSQLAKREECYLLCLNLAAAQSRFSPSAQAVAELLGTEIGSENPQRDLLFGFTILGDLCKGVSPDTLRPFLSKALKTSLDSSDPKDRNSLFCKLMGHIKMALLKDDIHDANRTLLSMYLESLLDQLSPEDETFVAYVDTVSELSSKFLERMTSPSSWWEVSSGKLRRSILVRSSIAKLPDTEEPLVWLNDCIDAAATCPSEQELLLREIASVIVTCRGRTSCREWLLQLLGRVQAALTSADKRAEADLLCDVFTLAVIALAGHDCLHLHPASLATSRPARLHLLPQALTSLTAISTWTPITSQVIEWLHHLAKSAVISPEFCASFYECLQALRHTAAMRQPGVWQRVVSV